jgi:hypothetical protein
MIKLIEDAITRYVAFLTDDEFCEVFSTHAEEVKERIEVQISQNVKYMKVKGWDSMKIDFDMDYVKATVILELLDNVKDDTDVGTRMLCEALKHTVKDLVELRDQGGISKGVLVERLIKLRSNWSVADYHDAYGDELEDLPDDIQGCRDICRQYIYNSYDYGYLEEVIENEEGG